MPELLRREAPLHAALDHRHPLVSCLINEDWKDARMASIFIFRRAASGLVSSGFLVDLAGLGLKDAWGNYGVRESEIEETRSRLAAKGMSLVPCELSLAAKIVHGGVAWARKWGFRLPSEHKIWLRLLEAVTETEVDLDLFGHDGKPFLIEREEEQDFATDADLDPGILSEDLEVREDGPSGETLARIGEIKAALVAFALRPEFTHEREKAFGGKNAARQERGPEGEWVNLLDRFMLESELEHGGTVLERFVEKYEHRMSEDVRELILGWQTVSESLFEVKGRGERNLHMKNLINERTYEVFHTTPTINLDLKPGSFLAARIVPCREFHLFSGIATVLATNPTERERAAFYKTAIELQLRNPELALRDNEEKLQKSIEAVRRQYQDFIAFFGSDEVLGTGEEILQKYQGFFDYVAVGKRDPATGLLGTQAYEELTGAPYRPVKVSLPDEVRKSDDVGMVCDGVEGMHFLLEYRQFLEVFHHPDQYLGTKEAEETVLGYLYSDSIPGVPFRRMAGRLPDNFRRVMAYYRDQEGLISDKLEDLMAKFKPDTSDKLPGIVTILDPEMARLARSAQEKTGSFFSRLRGLFKR